MSAKSVVLGVVAAGGMVLGFAGPASANIAWCMEDPPVQVATATGSNLTVNTMVSVARTEVHSLRAVQTTTANAPDGRGGTLITVQVALPAGISTATVTSSVNRYQVTASATGHGGSTVTLYLDVPAA